MSRRIDWDKVNRQKRVTNEAGVASGPAIIGKASCMPYLPDLPMTPEQQKWRDRSQRSYYEKKKLARAASRKIEKQERLLNEAAMLKKLEQKYGSSTQK